MKSSSPLFLFALLAALLLPGCSSVPSAGTDSIKIVDVASTHVPGGEVLSFRVTVDYTLASKEHGMLMLGFDVEGPRTPYTMMTRVKVDRGSGQKVLFTDVKVRDRSSLTAYVNLSEDPHPSSWDPLCSDTRQVALK